MDGHIWCIVDDDLHTQFKYTDHNITNAEELLKAFLKAHNKLNKHRDYDIYVDGVKIQPHTPVVDIIHKTSHTKPVHFKRVKHEHSNNYKIEKHFSHLTHSNLLHILKYFDIKSVIDIKLDDCVPKEFLNENNSYEYSKFKWPDSSNKMKLACEHILTQLKQSGVDMSRFKLEDVHLLDDKLFIETNKFIFKGGIDAVIVPSSCWSCLFELQMRVAFELKENIRLDENNCNEHCDQSVAKLIACYAASSFPTLLVLTDLSANFEIFKICDTIHHLKVNGKEAFLVIKHWLGLDAQADLETAILKDYKSSKLCVNKIQEKELSKRCMRRHFPEGYVDLDLDYGF